MRRIRLVIQYDGGDYVGWQTQSNGIAVQEVLQRELSRLTGEAIALHGSGRTDSGVHAFSQVAHFDTNSRIEASKFSYALNAGLPRDIRVVFSDETSPDFHARYDVLRKSYCYFIHNAPHSSPFLRRSCLHIHYRLDVPAMRSAAELFLGEHDFNAFRASGSRVESTVRTIYESSWSAHGDVLRYDVTGSGFLYNMVRIMVGAMLEIGLGRSDLSDISGAFEHCDRTRIGVTAPAHGLALARVQYADFDTAQIHRGGTICF
ncbi:MAG: tRNA pseudouridine(38-40) synthase TruA [Clostridia bacterium]|nr:tRNA pseudouridine(38-40) synthase TruA [Clostridia bacterium]